MLHTYRVAEYEIVIVTIWELPLMDAILVDTFSMNADSTCAQLSARPYPNGKSGRWFIIPSHGRFE